MNNVELLLLILIIVLFVLLIILLLYLINHKSNSKDLQIHINKDFLNLYDHLSDDFINLSNHTSNKIAEFENRLNNNLNEANKISNDTFNKINERLIKIDESQKALNELSSDIVSLQSILQDKKNRGSFGEIELYNLLEIAYGNNKNFYYKQYTLANDCKVDAALVGPNNLGLICIDSKFPLENYRRIYDNNLSNIEKENAKRDFKRDVSKHLKDIHDKYIIEGQTAPLAYMFIPAEAVFSEICANDDLIDLSYKLKVYIVSPTTLMAYITAIKSIYLGQKKNEKAKEIEIILNDLAIEFKRFKERQAELQSDFEKIVNHFKSVNVSANKIIKKFDAINSGDIEDENQNS